jgi:hypothetical protein
MVVEGPRCSAVILINIPQRCGRYHSIADAYLSVCSGSAPDISLNLNDDGVARSILSIVVALTRTELDRFVLPARRPAQQHPTCCTSTRPWSAHDQRGRTRAHPTVPRRLQGSEQAGAHLGEGPAEALVELVLPAGQDMATTADIDPAVVTRSARVVTLSARMDGLGTRMDRFDARMAGLATKEDVRRSLLLALTPLHLGMLGLCFTG